MSNFSLVCIISPDPALAGRAGAADLLFSIALRLDLRIWSRVRFDGDVRFAETPDNPRRKPLAHVEQMPHHMQQCRSTC